MTKHPNTNDMHTARDWAAHIISAPFTSSPMEAAAARVILHAIPAPPPKRPTLADMTDAEREACGGMQADLAGGGRVIILYGKVDSAGLVQVLESTLDVFRPRPADVTPRPDLPRMTWPGDTPAPALPGTWRLADHPEHGRVIVTNPTPSSDGNVYFVAPAIDPIGNDWNFCKPAELTYLDQGTD